jgi:hypothetical protein
MPAMRRLFIGRAHSAPAASDDFDAEIILVESAVWLGYDAILQSLTWQGLA